MSEIDEFEPWEDDESEEITGQAIEIVLSPSLPVPLPRAGSADQWAASPGLGWPARRRRFEITLAGRRFRLSAVTREFATMVGSIRGRVEVPVAALRTRVLRPPFVRDPKSLFDELREPIGEATALLSLLQRAPISWTEISIHTRVAPIDRPFCVRSAWRYRQADPFSDVDTSWGALVDPSGLTFGDLDQMLAALRSHVDSSAIRRSIYHLIQSRCRLPIHHALVHAFTALEALVGVLPSELDDVGDDDFAALEERLRKEIKNFAKERGFGASIRARMYGKLPELRRSPIAARVVDACASLSIDPTFLWSHAHIEPGVKVVDLIREAYARRSTLIHSGYLGDLNAAVGDLLRIRALTELILFLRVGGQFRWLRPMAWGDATSHGQWYSARHEQAAETEDQAPWDPFVGKSLDR